MSETREEHNFKNRKDWQEAINQAPNSSWIKSRNLGGSSSKYIPIAIQQALADIFFDEFDVIDTKPTIVLNEVICTVKIHILPSYPNAEPRTISGSAAKPIQTNRGSAIHKFPQGKKTNALEYNLPAARSSAVSNALETFGNIFGRNIGREVSAGFNFSNKKSKKNDKRSKNKKSKKE